MKGGLVEQLNKALNKDKSDYSFWMNERKSNLVAAGEKMRIDKMERSYGRILLHCTRAEPTQFTYILCIDPAFKRMSSLEIGKTIEIGLDTARYQITSQSYFYPNVTKILIKFNKCWTEAKSRGTISRQQSTETSILYFKMQ